jgi:hypothetical protein
MPTHAMGQLYREGWDEQLLVSPKPLHLRCLFSLPKAKIVISTEAAHAFYERRSGEIRFLTDGPFQPTHSPAFTIPQFIFRIFRPKIACQAPKRPNPIKQKEIDLAL